MYGSVLKQREQQEGVAFQWLVPDKQQHRLVANTFADQVLPLQHLTQKDLACSLEATGHCLQKPTWTVRVSYL